MTGHGPPGFQLAREANTFIDHIGPMFYRLNEKSVTLYLRIEKRHTNPIGTAHGGVLMTMMDLTLARSAGRYLGHDYVMATVQLSCNIMAAAREDEEVYGEAQVERATRLLTFVSGRLRVGERTLMTGTGVFRNPPEAGAVSV
jgi:uncharacterized protein (TIGR00369 family)